MARGGVGPASVSGWLGDNAAAYPFHEAQPAVASRYFKSRRREPGRAWMATAWFGMSDMLARLTRGHKRIRASNCRAVVRNRFALRIGHPEKIAAQQICG